jgi:hypothetical protein
MKSARLPFFSILVFVVIGFFGSPSRGASPVSNQIQLELATDRHSYRIGDAIHLSCRIINQSEAPIRILPWRGPYPIYWLEVLGLSGRPMRRIPTVFYELKMIPDKEDFILLKGKASYSVLFNGTLIEGKRRVFGKKESLRGMFIDFKNVSILLEGFGQYRIKAKFDEPELWQQEGERRYGFTDIWTGSVESKEVLIEIIP